MSRHRWRALLRDSVQRRRGPVQRLRALGESEMLQLNLLAALTGAVVALLTWLFLSGIKALQSLFYLGGSYMENDLGYAVVLVPAVGGLLAGFIIRYGWSGARGHGTPLVMEAMVAGQARLGTRQALTKGLAAATCIGSGFSLGRVGPMVLMAATFGSEVGQRFRLSVKQTRVMLGCGTAAAITTAFNAPLGGALFAIELILSQFRTRSFIPLMVASVTATAVARGLKGDLAAFQDLPVYKLNSPLEYPLYIGLGLLAGLGAVGFIRLLYAIDTLSERLAEIPLPVQTMLGGLAVGGIAYSFPHILGNGFDISENILNGEYLPLMLVSLLALKVLATSISIGSGGSGGVFTPSLFLGAALGGAYGHAVGGLDFTASPGAYALVGMAAFIAATTRATLTAIVLLFEMSGSNYEIILPLMLACVVADGVCYVFSEHTIYTAKLARKGISYDMGAGQDLMRMIQVREAMTRQVMTLTSDTPLELAITLVEETGHMSFPIVECGALVGIITWSDLHRAVGQGERHRLVGDYLTRDMVTVTPYDTLTTALDRLGSREVSHLPVVEPGNAQHLAGFITKGDILRAYNRRRLAEQQPSWEG